MSGLVPVNATLAWIGLACVSLGCAVAVFVLASVAPLPRPTLGRRGLKRRHALRTIDGMEALEPLLRWAAGVVGLVVPSKVLTRYDTRLRHGGDWRGLSPEEFLAMSALFGVGCALLSLLLVMFADITPAIVVVFALMGAMFPGFQLSGAIEERFVEVSRGLPAAIEQTAMCMEAGLDFPGALRQVVMNTGRESDPLVEEFELLLRELELGRSRRDALRNFESRVPTDSVKEFVGVVVQSEEKGNPLSEVLRIQAKTLRNRRSMQAEEAAGRASVLLAGPVMLVLISILILIMGPLFYKAAKDFGGG